MSVVDLGWCIARNGEKITDEDFGDTEKYIEVVSPSDCGDPAGYCPAESIRIEGIENIIALRDFLNKEYPTEEKSEQ
jgi:hypothetical protein